MNPQLKNEVNASIYSSSFREYAAIYPFDMKYWKYNIKNKHYWSIILLLAILQFCKSFLESVIQLRIFQKNISITSEKILLIRSIAHFNQINNPFYKDVLSSCTTISLTKDTKDICDFYVNINLRIILSAFLDFLKSLKSLVFDPNFVSVNGLKFYLLAAKIEAICNFHTFIYESKLRYVSELLPMDNTSQVLSFEQISWAAEVEKKVFEQTKLKQLQFGILPYFPYPTIGQNSEFIFRSRKILSEFKKNFPDRQFGLLKNSIKLEVEKRVVNSDGLRYIFATQPYRKPDEEVLVGHLKTWLSANNLQVRPHPRDNATYGLEVNRT